jgi:hypothetical protein
MKTRYRSNEEHAPGARVDEGFACAHTGFRRRGLLGDKKEIRMRGHADFKH